MPARKLLAYSQLLLGLLIVFLSSAVLSSRIILRGEIVSVPDVSGKTVAEAGRELARKKLSLQEKGLEFSDRFERGKIISQDPPAGSKIRVNRFVRVALSGGSEMVEIPALVGRSMEAAGQLLGEGGLQRGLIAQIHTPRYAAGRIIAQEPAPGERKIKRATPINFLVSQGAVEPRYLMPDLIGRKSGPTIARLQELGFKVADIRYSYYPGLDSGIIIKQFPPQGYGIATRSLISVEVSR
ncbi:MAG TPA: PASTA domain-containing protein [Candidatus Desulfaltia sp.]|nr:PASTA domain-containing protein [Candidatus Desulfaltia sp.]